MVEYLRDPGQLPDERYAALEREVIIGACLTALPPRHARLIHLRYEKERTLREIAEEFGVVESAVHGMHKRILGSIREGLAARGITKLEQII